MQLLEVLIERSINALNRPFSYVYLGKDKIQVGVRVVVSFANKDVMGFVIRVSEVNKSIEDIEKEVGFTVSEIKQVVDASSLLNDDLFALANEMADFYMSPLISILQVMLPSSMKPRLSALRGPKIHYEKYLSILDDNEEGLTPKQVELLRLIYREKKILKKDAGSPSIVKKLIELKRIQEIEIEVPRLEIPEYQKEQRKQLTTDQIVAVNKILKSDNKINLLQGVTGSGKTEVYLSLSEEILKQGRNILMLVPEISLTPIMVEYYLRRFHGKVAILHSELTPAEKYDEYRRIAKGEAKVVVGARSAIFAPLDNIGLIILDEEHVESYKQDTVPCYHAREVALMRAKKHNSIVVLGSATPSLESKARALKGIYNLVELKKRINEKELPRTYIVDMLNSRNLSKKSSMFSSLLLDKIKDRLDKKEQVILLINRRGFSSHITCRSCGHVNKCPTCGIALTYHRTDNMLKCHHCGYVEPYPNSCPNCGSKYLSKTGFGTERIEQEINTIFSRARTLRLDSDVGKVRNNIAKTVNAFREGQADILIGTQMIAKGHDFPNVTLVGIVLADIGLSLPSFRSSELAFNLITQAVGRSGRSSLEGEAIIQTYSPDNYAVQLAAKQDYEAFFKKEMMVRKVSSYPPYTYLVSLTLRSKNEDIVIDTSFKICEDLASKAYQDVYVLGPTVPYIPFENNFYERDILIKYRSDKDIRPYINNLMKTLQHKSNINIVVNVNPYNY